MDAGAEVSGEIFNVGSTERVTIHELAQRVLERTGSQSKIVAVPYDEVYGLGIEDMLHREPAIDKITNAIGWEPTVQLEGILEDVIRHVRAEPVLVER
jgi:nucleoside-diphosphate-sugar epimerase